MSRRGQELGPTTRQRHFDAPLRIGVLSDTHIYPGSKRVIPPGVIRLFQRAGVGLIVHLGDANTRSVLDELAEIAPLIAVPGNNDDEVLHHILPEAVRFQVGSTKFGAVHGHGGRSAHQEAVKRWAGKVDCVLFGHSHKPLLERVDTSTLVNPGSPTDKRWFDHFGIALIDVNETGFTPDLILFTNDAHLDNVDVTLRTGL